MLYIYIIRRKMAAKVVSPLMSLDHLSYNMSGDSSDSDVTRVNANFDEEIRKLNFYAYTFVIPLICLFGVVGNSLNLIVLCKGKNLQSVSYVYIRWMAIADLFIMILMIPFTINKAPLVAMPNTIHMARYTAHWQLLLINGFIGASDLLVVALTLDRFFAICHPMITKDWRTFNNAKILVFCIYVFSFLLHVPYTFHREVKETMVQSDNSTIDGAMNVTRYDVIFNQVVYNNVWYKHVWVWTKETLTKFIPIITVLILNASICIKYRRRQQKLKKLRKRTIYSAHRMGRGERRLVILLFCIVAIFLICTVPAAIATALLSEALYKTYPFHMFMSVANCLETANHAINFYVYSVASTDFRKNFRYVFCRLSIEPDEESSAFFSGQSKGLCNHSST